MAGRGRAGRGVAWQGMDFLSSHSRFGVARHGGARPGAVWQGKVFFLTEVLMFDIDLQTIEPGTVLEMADCEKLFGYTRENNPTRYQFDLMRLADWIHKELCKFERILTVVCDGSDVRVLTHQQASDYNVQHFANAIKKMRKCHKRLAAVDTRELDAAKITIHDKSLVRQSRILQMIKTVRSDVQAEVRKLERPVMFKKQ